MTAFEKTLNEGLQSVSIQLEKAWIEPLEKYYLLLRKWSAKMNLISTSDTTNIVDRHFVDSLSLLRLEAVRECHGNAVDVGSGAGFPGLALAMACPNLQWTLVEPRQRRGAFLNQVIFDSRITNARWESTRIPDPSLEGKFQLAVSRATFAPERLVHELVPLLKPNGSMVVMAAREPEMELPEGWTIRERVAFKIDNAPRWLGTVSRNRD